MSADTESDAPARILLALPEGPLRQRLMDLLSDRDVAVTSTTDLAGLGTVVDATQADVVILRHSDLGSDGVTRLDALADDEDAPDVVVVGPDLDVGARVDLVSAGATEVIDIANLDDASAQNIELLASGDGGHAAPDSRTGPTPSLSDFASHSKSMLALLDLVQRVAPTDSTLLITGETGVGKEHLARAIHAASPRHAGPFVAVNCGALASELLESELFGHKAGAFTGAKEARKGAFASAAGGTILLDEIGEMPTAMQVKLLRVLQRSEVRPVGSDEDVHVDVRILAATNRDLRQDVEEGRFREDLYFRLNVVELALDPLRKRPEDLPTLIGALMRHFREQTGREHLPALDDDALEAMLAYEWPGNVRELTNVVERALLVGRGPTIRLADLPDRIARPAGGDGSTASLAQLPAEVLAGGWKEARETILATTERAYLHAILEECKGVVGAAAERAELSPRSLYEKMKRHGLRKEDYR